MEQFRGWVFQLSFLINTGMLVKRGVAWPWPPMTGWSREPPGASILNKTPPSVPTLSPPGSQAHYTPSEAALAAQRPESQVHGRIDWPCHGCHSIVIDREFLKWEDKAGPWWWLMSGQGGFNSCQCPTGCRQLIGHTLFQSSDNFE